MTTPQQIEAKAKREEEVLVYNTRRLWNELNVGLSFDQLLFFMRSFAAEVRAETREEVAKKNNFKF